MRISVVVPVYQAEKYLSRCLDSLVCQKFDEYEIILIDDGSVDESGKICDNYALKYDFIKVYHKKNEGVSSARQDGLNNAIGEYVIFTDPDDWVEEDYLSILYQEAIRNDSDMVICDFYAEYSDNTIYMSQKPSQLSARIVLNEFFPYHNGCTWNKLIKKNCLNKYNITFPEDFKFCEDLYMNCTLLKNEIKIGYVAKALYHYDQVVNENSLVRYYDNNTYAHDIMIFDKFSKLLNGEYEPTRMKSVLMRNFAERAFMSGVFDSKKYKKCFFKYRNLLKKESYDFKGKMIYFASLGFYKPIYVLFREGRKIKNQIKFYGKSYYGFGCIIKIWKNR